MRIRRRATAKKPQPLMSGDRMPCSRRDENGVAGTDDARLAVDFHFTAALEDEVKFLRQLVVMALGRAPGGDAGFGETLFFHRGIGAVEDASDGRAILGRKRRLMGEVLDDHARERSGYGIERFSSSPSQLPIWGRRFSLGEEKPDPCRNRKWCCCNRSPSPSPSHGTPAPEHPSTPAPHLKTAMEWKRRDAKTQRIKTCEWRNAKERSPDGWVF